MTRKYLLALSLFMCILSTSCDKEDDTDKLSSNPFPYQEEDAGGIFTVRTSISSSAYYAWGNQIRYYYVDGSIPGPPLPANLHFMAAGVSVPSGLTTFEYEAIHDLDSTMRQAFGQENAYSLLIDSTAIFTATVTGPQPILISSPTDYPQAPPINVTRKTQIKWNADPANSDGVVVEISRPGKDKYVRIADDGILTLNSIWASLPAGDTFWLRLYRGTHSTVIGSDSKKYIINVFSMSASHEYNTQGI